jgi:hypothetical protein
LNLENELNSDRLNRWLTLGANIGVLIGIILLLVELAQNREMMRAQTRHEMAMGIVDMQHAVAENEQLADIMHRSSVGEKLTPTERLRHRHRLNALLRYWEDVHYQYRLGLYDEPEFSSQREAWRGAFLSNNHLREYWCETKGRYSEKFRLELDALMPDNIC